MPSFTQEIDRIVHSGISHLIIDIEKGVDVAYMVSACAAASAPAAHHFVSNTTQPAASVAPSPVVLGEELDRAARVREEALGFVKTMMEDARYGRLPELEKTSQVVQNIVDSIASSPDAFLAMLQIKDIDNYTFLHSVSVCALMAAFCRSLDFPADVTFQASLGGLIHDIGKAMVPPEILNKPGRLTDEEYEIVKRHAADGHAMLSRIPGIGVVPLNITLCHHERLDGSGYPSAFTDGAISELAQMAAIVDVYDVITADRPNHLGMPPALALAILYEWSSTQYSRHYVEAFIRCLGIFPSGSLVLLGSGRLGVVAEQNSADMRAPMVNKCEFAVLHFATRRQTQKPYEHAAWRHNRQHRRSKEMEAKTRKVSCNQVRSTA